MREAFDSWLPSHTSTCAGETTTRETECRRPPRRSFGPTHHPPGAGSTGTRGREREPVRAAPSLGSGRSSSENRGSRTTTAVLTARDRFRQLEVSDPNDIDETRRYVRDLRSQLGPTHIASKGVDEGKKYGDRLTVCLASEIFRVCNSAAVSTRTATRLTPTR